MKKLQTCGCCGRLFRATVNIVFFCFIFECAHGDTTVSSGPLHHNKMTIFWSCHLTSTRFRAANLLDIRWQFVKFSGDDVAGELSPRCLLVVYDVTGRGVNPQSASSLCTSPPKEMRVLNHSLPATDARFMLWNATGAGVEYVVCLGPEGEGNVVSDEHLWIGKYVHTAVHQPPVIQGPCSVLISGSMADSHYIDGIPTFIYKANKMITVHCPVTGYPKPMLKWCKTNRNCNNSSSISQTETLTISNASKADAGIYFLTAINEYGQVHSHGFMLKMAEINPLVRTDQKQSASEGDNLALTCRGLESASFPPANFTWYRVRDESDPYPQRVRPSEHIAFGVDGTLVFISLQLADASMYMCNAGNEIVKTEYGGSFYKVEVEVRNRSEPLGDSAAAVINNYKPAKAVSGLRGSTIKLQCLFSGRPLPSIQWTRNHQHLHSMNETRYRWSLGSHTLTIVNVSVNDSGQYECQATNAIGPSASYHINLDVYELPVITKLPESVNVSVGDIAVFHCEAAGKPLPVIHWFMNGIQQQPAVGPVLKLDNGQWGNNSGTVWCNASNAHGYAIASAYLVALARTRITEPPADINISIPLKVDSFQQSVVLPCGAVTDNLTQLQVHWQISAGQQPHNNSDTDRPWRVTANRSFVVDINEKTISWSGWSRVSPDLHCLEAMCVATNGLTTDNSLATVCWTYPSSSDILALQSLHDIVSEHMFAIGSSAFIVIVLIIVVPIVVVCFVRHRHGQRNLRKPGQNSLGNGSAVSTLPLNGSGTPSVDSATQLLMGTRSPLPSTSDSDCFVFENGWCSSLVASNDKLRAAVEGIKDLIVPRERIRLGETIGRGQFGRVVSAELKSSRGSVWQHVAVKTMKFRPDESDMVELFLKEAQLMKDFQDPNVLSIVGVSFESDGSPMVILPYMANGDLRQYILNPEMNITILELLKMGIQVARGMLYLSSRRFVHRDLAARNCMVNDRGQVKVADFGLSRQLLAHEYYQSNCSGTTPVPVRWLAPESLETHLFTTMSDVWSYGVLLWELMTRGAVPYSEVDNYQITPYIQQGGRLSQPTYCPDVIYEVMQQCWNENPQQRPTFQYLVDFIENVIRSAKPGCRISSILYQNISRDGGFENHAQNIDEDQELPDLPPSDTHYV